jgi:hypothetical protein
MIASALFALSLGIALGLRHTVYPLMLAVLLIAAYAVAVGIIFSSGLAMLLLGLVVVSTSLQLGFMAGAVVRLGYRRYNSSGLLGYGQSSR